MSLRFHIGAYGDKNKKGQYFSLGRDVRSNDYRILKTFNEFFYCWDVFISKHNCKCQHSSFSRGRTLFSMALSMLPNKSEFANLIKSRNLRRPLIAKYRNWDNRLNSYLKNWRNLKVIGWIFSIRHFQRSISRNFSWQWKFEKNWSFSGRFTKRHFDIFLKNLILPIRTSAHFRGSNIAKSSF